MESQLEEAPTFAAPQEQRNEEMRTRKQTQESLLCARVVKRALFSFRNLFTAAKSKVFQMPILVAKNGCELEPVGQAAPVAQGDGPRSRLPNFGQGSLEGDFFFLAARHLV